VDHEQAVRHLARRRRLRRRLGIAAVPVALVVAFVVATRDDDPPGPTSLLALVALAAAVALGWWWLERGAGGSSARPGRTRPGGPTAEELDDARAELALRTCAAPSPGGRARLEALVARRSRDARAWAWVGPGYLAVAGVMGATVLRGDDGIPWPLPLLWAALAAVGMARAFRWRRLTRRWLAAHGSPEVAGRR
jgi:hypothetical protein